MTAFYRNWQSGMGKAEALQAAQAEIRANPDWASPFFWAGFVLSGDAGEITKPEVTASPTETVVSEPKATATTGSESEDEMTWPVIIGLGGLLGLVVLLVAGLILRKRRK